MRFNEESTQAYAFTTENIGEYFPFIDFNGKKVLTVASSGDHTINSLMSGAREVTYFDIVKPAIYMTELKLEALKQLSYEEFKRFFMREDSNGEKNPNPFDFKIYLGLRQGISQEAKHFFDGLYQTFSNDGGRLRQSEEHFYYDPFLDSKVTKFNPYLKSDLDYNLAKLSIRNRKINSLCCDVRNLGRLEDRFDVVLLSNISDYIHEMFPGRKNLVRFTQEVLVPLSKKLNQRGVICAAYINEGSSYGKPLNCPIDNPKIRRQQLQIKGMKYDEKRFEGVVEFSIDTIVMLRFNEIGGQVK